MFKSPVHSLRLFALTEGVSFLVLLFVAMPLKYWGDMPAAVKIFGWMHGVLFILLCFALVNVMLSKRWPISRAAMVFIAALLPFGPFLIDSRIKEYE